MCVVCITGVDNIDIDIAMQKVTVMGWADQKKVLKTVRKTGRRAELWPYPCKPEYQNFNRQYYYYQQQLPQQSQQQPIAAANYYYSFQPPSSSYNYWKHGYSGDFGYYQQSPHSQVFDERTSALFSDENPHACSIM